ncbi:hypothetical protein T265_01276 [Opisthorchis viverrini]|uniref:Delta-like protein n=1 Tax=Opisthorchis viverrini TaxID=6198 RepID=A0A074ZZC9_OPIVI|nr:hypothetical protein T265_01276 [Opisthorchis viverrini]KER32803.1 hypothetical protein T265_01276 [Opisthorchis viverrini]
MALCLHLICVSVFFLHCCANHLATFSIKILEFQNHERRRMDGTCCGKGKTGERNSSVCVAECSLEFRICLEPFSIPVSLTDRTPYAGPCIYGEGTTGHWGNTDMQYTFSEAPTHKINITLSWPLSFAVIVEAYDMITLNKRYLIDRAVHRSLLRPVSNFPSQSVAGVKEWHHVTTTTQVSGYTFSIRLACQPDHYNNTCTKICLKNSTQYVCDSNGDKVCEPGWSGSECDTPICKVGCHPNHGNCLQPGECECAIGWQGPYCDECVKYPGCKHGTCDDAPFTCRCLPNWGGPFCDQDLDYCSRHQPCKNGGICKNEPTASKQFSCSCPKDFTGELCETKLAPCTWNPCKRGRCVPKGADNYRCECEPGWRGDHCEKNIDYCLKNSCLNGGICQDLDGIGFRCLCPPGFKGANCQLRSPCGNSRCVHARDCTQLIPPVNGVEYSCLCQPGWTGQFCDQNIDDCVDKCQNGGTCHDLVDDFYCTCPKGFYGRHCEINRECTSEPCQNNGICHEITGGYRCECPNGYTGHNCEIATNGCSPNPCQNTAYCYTVPNGFYCKCSSKHYGQFCEHERPYCGPAGCAIVTDPCLTSMQSRSSVYPSLTQTVPQNDTALSEETHAVSSPWGVCGPHGTCVKTEDEGMGYMCVCSSGFQGKYCQEPVNHCEDNPCMHGGTCINTLDGVECMCQEGFVGPLCETPQDLCHPNPCQNGGNCHHTIHPGDFFCSCDVGWSGRWCQLRTEDPCNASRICFNNGACHSNPHIPGGFQCECGENWMGSVCHLRRPDSRACANRTLCKNGATCVDVGDSFNCICRPGFDGQYCQNNINECSSMPCYNNGTCVDLINSFECQCPKGFTGSDCSININECATNPCAFGSTCIDRVGDYQCICPESRHGRHCEEVLIYSPPKPPACNFHERIYDHNETWTYDCQHCQCDMGQVVCKDEFCGYWSCFRAVGQSDPFACKADEVCHILSSGGEGECFVPPCYLRTVCLNTTQSIPAQLRRMMPDMYPGPAMPGCRPNAAHLNNRCARIILQFSRARLPYGVTVGDVCMSVRQLPTTLRHREKQEEAKNFGMSCDLRATYTKEQGNAIEITISADGDQLQVGPDGQEHSFAHLLAYNISKDIAQKAATNITMRKDELGPLWTDETMPLPPFSQLLVTNQLDKYWHRVLLGVVEIHVDTMVLREKDFGSPILIPLVCSLILAAAVICTIFICAYAQRKHHQLLLKYASSVAPNNDPSANAKFFTQNVDNNIRQAGKLTNRMVRPVSEAQIQSQFAAIVPVSIVARTSSGKRIPGPASSLLRTIERECEAPSAAHVRPIVV